IDYFLKSAPKDAVELQILDGKGSVVRKLSSKKAAEGASPEEEEFGISRPSEKLPAEEGLNRFVWDMRGEAPARVPGAVSWGGRPIGVLVVPGTYQIKLTVGGKSLTTSAEVQKDPPAQIQERRRPAELPDSSDRPVDGAARNRRKRGCRAYGAVQCGVRRAEWKTGDAIDGLARDSVERSVGPE